MSYKSKHFFSFLIEKINYGFVNIVIVNVTIFSWISQTHAISKYGFSIELIAVFFRGVGVGGF